MKIPKNTAKYVAPAFRGAGLPVSRKYLRFLGIYYVRADRSAVSLIVRRYAATSPFSALPQPRLHPTTTTATTTTELCNGGAIAVVRCIRGSLKCLLQLPVSQRGEARMGTKSSSFSVITIVPCKCIVGFSRRARRADAAALRVARSIPPDIFGPWESYLIRYFIDFLSVGNGR